MGASWRDQSQGIGDHMLQLLSSCRPDKMDLTTKALVMLALSGACTRPVDDGPQGAETAQSSASTASMPSATNPSSSGSGPSNTEAPEPSKEESDAPSKEPSEASPDEESPSSSGSKDNAEVGPTCKGESLHCAAPTPAGWFGPLQLQKMKSGSQAQDCEAALPKSLLTQGVKAPKIRNRGSSPLDESLPGVSKNLFSESIKGADARCSGCKGELKPGTCISPKWSLRKLDDRTPSGCGDLEIQEWGVHINEVNCPSYNLSSKAGEGWSIVPPRVMLPGECVGDTSQVVEEIEPVQFGSFYRSCKIKPSKKTCAGEHETCLNAQTDAPWMNRVCVARQGEHECKSPAYPERILTFADFLDDRRCSNCTAKMQGGQESCDALVFVQFNDTNKCSNPQQVRPEDVCVPSDQYDALSPITATIRSLEYRFSGVCAPSRLEAEGEVQALLALTFCCQA